MKLSAANRVGCLFLLVFTGCESSIERAQEGGDLGSASIESGMEREAAARARSVKPPSPSDAGRAEHVSKLLQQHHPVEAFLLVSGCREQECLSLRQTAARAALDQLIKTPSAQTDSASFSAVVTGLVPDNPACSLLETMVQLEASPASPDPGFLDGLSKELSIFNVEFDDESMQAVAQGLRLARIAGGGSEAESCERLRAEETGLEAQVRALRTPIDGNSMGFPSMEVSAWAAKRAKLFNGAALKRRLGRLQHKKKKR